MAKMQWHWLREKKTVPVDPYAVTVDEFKEHINLAPTNNQYNNIIGEHILAAQEFLERETGYVLLFHELVMGMSGFSSDGWPIVLPVQPVGQINSITYTDADGTTGVAFTDYVFEPSRPARIRAPNGWPAGATDVAIDFTVGNGNTANVPPSLKQGVRMVAALYFNDREAAQPLTYGTVPFGVQSIINEWKMGNDYMFVGTING